MSESAPSPRRVPFWLTLSLMGNMLLFGLMAGLLLRSGPSSDGPRVRPDIERTLSEEDRRELRSLMRELYRLTEAQRDERHAIRQELSEALRREPFDEAAVRAGFEKLRLADEAVHTKMHEAMILRLKTLPPERRERVAGLLAFRPDGRRPERHRKDRPERPPRD